MAWQMRRTTTPAATHRGRGRGSMRGGTSVTAAKKSSRNQRNGNRTTCRGGGLSVAAAKQEEGGRVGAEEEEVEEHHVDLHRTASASASASVDVAPAAGLPGTPHMERLMKLGADADDDDDFLEGYPLETGAFIRPAVDGDEWGLSCVGDLKALGIAGAKCADRLDFYELSSEYSLCGGFTEEHFMQLAESRVSLSMTAQMGQTMGQMRLKRRKARDPPDLPSYILDQRIVWLGMEIVPSVAELIVAELLYLASDSSKPICVYVSSGGTQNERKQSLSMDTDAYGIVDTMNYINARGGPSRIGKVDNVATVSMAVADGNAALIVACGSKGQRRAYRNTRFKLAVPRMNPTQGSATDMMIRANNLEDNTKMYVDLLARGTGRTEEQIWKDVVWDRYLDVEEAIEYGLIDAMMPDNLNKEKKGLLKRSR